jgi:hypothetical protein
MALKKHAKATATLDKVINKALRPILSIVIPSMGHKKAAIKYGRTESEPAFFSLKPYLF